MFRTLLRPRPIVVIVSIVGSTIVSTPAGAAADAQKYESAKLALEQRLAPLRAAYNGTRWPATMPAEAGEALGHDPAACAAFLRRAARFESYRGVLRGAAGAMAAGGGNSADLALLLREMIERPGESGRARFAVAELSEGDSAKLVGLAAAAPPPRPILIAAGAAKSSVRMMQQVPPAELEGFRKHVADINQVLADARDDVARVTAALGGAGAADRGQTPAGETQEAVSAARQHVWVQVQRDGKWETFDPVADLPLPSSGVRTYDRLPEDWHHRVAVKIEAERLSDGNLTRQTLAGQNWAASALNGHAVEVLIVPAELSIERLLDPEKRGGDLLSQARDFKTFGVVLHVPGEAALEKTRVEQSFDLEGEKAAPAGPTGVGSFDPFKRGGAIGGRKIPKAELAAVWLTITVSSPGAKDRVIERALLDRVGPAARASGKPAVRKEWEDPRRVHVGLIQRHQVLATGGAVGLERLAREALSAVVERHTLEGALAIQYGQFASGTGAGSLAEMLSGLKLPDEPADAIAVSDGALALAQASSAGTATCYAAAPGVIVRSESLDLAPGEKDALVNRVGLDVADVPVRVLVAGGSEPDPFLLHGALLSELEGRLLSVPHGPVTRRWAAGVLREAERQKIPMKAVRSASDLARIVAPADAKAVMASRIAAGAVLVAPAKAIDSKPGPQFAWWELAGRRLVAVGAGGRGESSSEGMMVLKHISVPMVKHCMHFVACFNKAVAGGASIREGGADCMAEAVKDIVKDTLDEAIKEFVFKPAREGAERMITGKEGGEYGELLEKAHEAYEKFKQGQEAGQAGREVGESMGLRLYLLLSNGRDIAEYASKL